MSGASYAPGLRDGRCNLASRARQSARQTDGSPDQTVLGWMRKNPLCVFVVTFVMLDWVPPAIATKLGFPAERLSGATFWVGPVVVSILIALGRHPWTLRNATSGWIGILSVIVGVGPAVCFQTVEPQRLVAMLVSSLLLFYFRLIRTLDDCRAILLYATYLSIATGIGQYLGSIGYLIPFVDTVSVFDKSISRVFVAGNTANVGFIPLFAAASAGGILLTRTGDRSGLVPQLIAFGLLGSGCYAISVAAQRSSAIAFSIALLLALSYYIMSSKKSELLSFGLTVIIAVGLIGANGERISEKVDSLRSRLDESNTASNLSSASELRLAGVKYFLHDLTTELPLVPKGPGSMKEAIGIFPHNVPAESYYYGGLILLLALLAGLIKILKNIAHTYRRGRTEAHRSFAVVMLFLGLGMSCHFMFQTGLLLRPLAMLMGLGLCSGWQAAWRSEGRPQSSSETAAK